MENTMTTREVAEILGTTPNVITENAKKYLNKDIRNGVAAHYTEEEVTVLLEKMKENPSNNSKILPISSTYRLETSLTSAYKARQFVESLDYMDDSTVDTVTATIASLSANLIEALHKKNKRLQEENTVLKHQIEYEKVIGCLRWSDVKKKLGIKDKWDTVAEATGAEFGVDWFKKPMGMDNYPTILIKPDFVDVIAEEYK